MKISQREARRLQKRVQVLERMESERRRRWSSEYPGVHLCTTTPTEWVVRVVEAARRLGHAVVIVNDGDKCKFYGVNHPAEPV